MNFPHFFIDRPIFAGVISIVITLVGVIALSTLPIAQYPDIAPPTIQVTASYPGANAKGRIGNSCDADRAASQWRREHALHVLAKHE